MLIISGNAEETMGKGSTKDEIASPDIENPGKVGIAVSNEEALEGDRIEKNIALDGRETFPGKR